MECRALKNHTDLIYQISIHFIILFLRSVRIFVLEYVVTIGVCAVIFLHHLHNSHTVIQNATILAFRKENNINDKFNCYFYIKSIFFLKDL